jgi:hypothetical protein
MARPRIFGSGSLLTSGHDATRSRLSNIGCPCALALVESGNCFLLALWLRRASKARACERWPRGVFRKRGFARVCATFRALVSVSAVEVAGSTVLRIEARRASKRRARRESLEGAARPAPSPRNAAAPAAAVGRAGPGRAECGLRAHGARARAGYAWLHPAGSRPAAAGHVQGVRRPRALRCVTNATTLSAHSLLERRRARSSRRHA